MLVDELVDEWSDAAMRMARVCGGIEQIDVEPNGEVVVRMVYGEQLRITIPGVTTREEVQPYVVRLRRALVS